MECSPTWLEPIARALLVVGALVGAVGASRAARDLVRRSPHTVWAAVVRVWQATWEWMRRMWSRVRGWWRRVTDWGKRLWLRWRGTHTVGVGMMVTDVLTASGFGEVTPPPVVQRVERLEEWRSDSEANQRVEAKWLVAGFFMIAAGSILDWVAC